MALQAGAVVAKFKADITDLKSGVSQAKGVVNDLKSHTDRLGDSFKTSFTGFMNTAKIAGAVASGAFALFAKSSIDAKSELDKAIISLDIIAERFGHSGKEAGKLAVTLGKELRIGTASASDSLQNLIKSGLNLDQASDLLRRFTNEAMTGKSNSIDLATAVNNLSFAFATGNSALGNMSGISENWSDITEKGATIMGKWNGKANEQAGITPQLAEQIKAYEASLKSQGKTLDANDAEQAKYIGLLQLTNLTMGSSARFQGTYADNMAQLSLKINDLKIALGTLLQNALNPLVAWFANSGIMDNMARFITVVGNLGATIAGIFQGQDLRAELEEALSFFTNDDWGKASLIADYIYMFVDALKAIGEWIVANQESVLMFLKGMGIALGALLIIGTIIGLLNLLFNPITLIVLAVGALFVAWQNNFLGIRDITDTIVQFVIAIFQYLQGWWKEWGNDVMNYINSVWNIIKGIFQTATGIIMMILGVFIGLMTGDWKKAGEIIKNGAKQTWDGIVNLISGAFNLIMSALQAFIANFTNKLDGLFNKAREIGGKIKDALMQMNPFHHNSPSLVELVQRGTSIIEAKYADLADTINSLNVHQGVLDLAGGGNVALAPLAGSAGNGTTVNQYINQDIKDSADAQVVNEHLAFLFRNSQ